MMSAIDHFQAIGDQLDSGDDQHAVAWVRTEVPSLQLVKLPGDASTRKYYRLVDGKFSNILMKMESFVEYGDKLPFIAVQRSLKKVGVDVPEILAHDAKRGLILLEDLGDVTLLKNLQSVTDTSIERRMYERVIDGLVRMQVGVTQELVGEKLDAFSLKFDFEKLYWEVNHTIEHFYLKHLSRTFTPEHKTILESRFKEICQTLADEPGVFTHRDFHSRNIMAIPEGRDPDRIVMIDFQDARMGPAQYDLVSLLKDSYYQLEEVQVSALIDYYIRRYESESGKRIDRAHFMKIFDLMSVQRNFKAIGSFASFQNKRGIITYLKYIGNTFENIRRTLLRHPEFSDLRETLFYYYYF